jgi:hypothetical protein
MPRTTSLGNYLWCRRSRNVTESGLEMQGGVGCGSPTPLRKGHLQHVPIVSHCHHHRANFVSNFLSRTLVLVARGVSCARRLLRRYSRSEYRILRVLECGRVGGRRYHARDEQCQILCETEGWRDRFLLGPALDGNPLGSEWRFDGKNHCVPSFCVAGPWDGRGTDWRHP